MASNLRVDQITSSTTGSVSIGTATFTGGLSGDITGLNVTGVITATTLNQNVSGILTAQNGIDITGTSAIGNEQLQLSWLSPNGQIKAKNTAGSPAANLDLYSTDTGGNTNLGIRLQYTGNVGIGTDNPGDKLSVYNSNSGNPTGITIRNTEASSQYSHARLRLESQNAAAYGEIWADVANAGLRLGYNSSNTVKINSSGNIVFNSGSGIDFSAASGSAAGSTSALLDDYEEGTWTPVIKSGTNTISYSGGSPAFKYTKIGNQVTVYFVLDGGVTTSGTTGGGFSIEGLPFSSASTVRTAGPPCFFYSSGLRAADWPIFPHVAQGNSTVNMYYKSSYSANYVISNVNQVGGNSYVFWQITYTVS